MHILTNNYVYLDKYLAFFICSLSCPYFSSIILFRQFINFSFLYFNSFIYQNLGYKFPPLVEWGSGESVWAQASASRGASCPFQPNQQNCKCVPINLFLLGKQGIAYFIILY